MAETKGPETSKKEKIFNWISNIILILVILFTMAVSTTAYISRVGSGVPSFMGVRPFSVQTESMEPVFYKGDLIIDLAVSDTAELKEGDIITFWTVIDSRRMLNTHRILEIREYETYRGFITKGDNNSVEDYMEVHQAEIVGKFKFRIPYLGRLIDFLKTGKGFFICIVIPVFLFFLFNLYQFIRALLAYKEEQTRAEYENKPEDEERLMALARKLLEEERAKERAEQEAKEAAAAETSAQEARKAAAETSAETSAQQENLHTEI